VDWYLWVLTMFSLVGVILNIYKVQWCFWIWAGTNFSWMLVDFYRGIYAQAALFAVYFFLAIWGIVKWKS